MQNPNEPTGAQPDPTVEGSNPDPVAVMYEHDCIAVTFAEPPCRRSITVMSNMLTLEAGWRVDRVEADLPASNIAALSPQHRKATRFFFWVSRPLRQTPNGHTFPNPGDAFRLAYRIASGQQPHPAPDPNDLFTDRPTPPDCYNGNPSGKMTPITLIHGGNN